MMSEKRYTFECIENNCLIYEDGVWLKIEEVVDLLNEQQYLLNNQNELLDEICTIFKKYGVETGYNKRILEVALENLTNGDDV